MIGFKPKNTSLNGYQHQDIRLAFCAYDGCDQKKRWGPGAIEYYKLFYAIEHSGILTLEGRTYDIEAGSGFIVPPDKIVTYEPLIDEEWRYFWITFEGDFAEHLLQRAGISLSAPVFQIHDQSSFVSYFAEMFHSYIHSNTMDIKALSAFYTMLSVILEDNGGGGGDLLSVNANNHYVNEAIDFIRSNYFRTLQVHEIAEHVNIDRKYLYKLFKKSTQYSPKQYLIEVRMSRAEELLKTTCMSIAEIANSVGYDDQFLFSKTFKKWNGHSPTEYRKQQ